MTASALRHSPLHERHRALGAKLADFGGWEMPIDYAGSPSKLGVVAEHTAVRTAAGIFDVTHLGKLSVTGPGAAAFLDSCLTNSLARIRPGQAQYSLCCTPDGGVVDDLIVYLRADDDLLVVPNAANCATVAGLLADAAPPGVTVADRHTDFGVLAVQGPRADDVVAALGLPVGHDYMSFVDASWNGGPVVVCRSGYTGERGYELLPRWDDAGELWDALLRAGEQVGGVPCGLGARDTLRTEMGYPLHGSDISPRISPVEAGLGWAIGWDKPAFWGRDALLAQKSAGRPRKLVGLEGLDRAIPRCHMAVSTAEGGAAIGEITSGTFSPTRKVGIGLALVATDAVSEGDEVLVDVRGRAARFRVTKPPFVPSHVR